MAAIRSPIWDNDDTDLGTGYGETLSMSSATTHALRIGGRLTGDFSETTSWKVGAAYEHVFDGDAEADILFGGSAAALDVPSLSGNTGILELGLSVKLRLQVRGRQISALKATLAIARCRGQYQRSLCLLICFKRKEIA